MFQSVVPQKHVKRVNQNPIQLVIQKLPIFSAAMNQLEVPEGGIRSALTKNHPFVRCYQDDCYLDVGYPKTYNQKREQEKPKPGQDAGEEDGPDEASCSASCLFSYVFFEMKLKIDRKSIQSFSPPPENSCVYPPNLLRTPRHPIISCFQGLTLVSYARNHRFGHLYRW